MTSEERLRSNTLFILQSSFGANSEGRTQMSCYYSLTNTSELPTFTLKMCPFKFKNKIFSLPAVETQKKVTEFRSPWMFLFQMRFSIANHFECLPDHLDSSSVGQHTCHWTAFRWNNIPSQKWNWHPASWWKTEDLQFIK